jgi:glycogen debranching enzyme
VHPWETGADDSPRWDDLCPGGFEAARWFERKGELVASISRSRTGAPIANGQCAVAPAGFNALVAFNALELLPLVADDTLEREARELVERLDARWDSALGSWRDAGITQHGSGRVRTLDALLPSLVTPRASARDRVFADLVHASAFGAPFGPTGVHRDEPSFDPSLYWRGPAWPQLNYLFWVAARRGGVASASSIALMTARAALDSGFAEYWNPDTGRGLGAIPQAWTGLALLMAGQR